MVNPEATSNPIIHMAQQDAPSDITAGDGYWDFDTPDMRDDFDTEMKDLDDLLSVFDGADGSGVNFTQAELALLGMEELSADDVLHGASDATSIEAGVDAFLQRPSLTGLENYQYERSQYSIPNTPESSESRLGVTSAADSRNYSFSSSSGYHHQAAPDYVPQVIPSVSVLTSPEMSEGYTEKRDANVTPLPDLRDQASHNTGVAEAVGKDLSAVSTYGSFKLIHSTTQQLQQGHSPSTPCQGYRSLHFDSQQQNAFPSYTTQDQLQTYEYGYEQLSQHAHNSYEASVPALTQAPIRALTFDSLAQAETAMSTRPIYKDWRSPENDQTIPRTIQDRSVFVTQLFDAMNDSTQCKDKRGTPAFKNRWSEDACQPYDPEQMEKVCWNLLDIAEQLHAFGPCSLAIYDIEVLATVRKSRHLTFEQRIENICALLRMSKNRCFMLMKGEGLYSTVGAPVQRLSGSVVNHTQNEKRQKFIVAGREVVNHG